MSDILCNIPVYLLKKKVACGHELCNLEVLGKVAGEGMPDLTTSFR